MCVYVCMCVHVSVYTLLFQLTESSLKTVSDLRGPRLELARLLRCPASTRILSQGQQGPEGNTGLLLLEMHTLCPRTTASGRWAVSHRLHRSCSLSLPCSFSRPLLCPWCPRRTLLPGCVTREGGLACGLRPCECSQVSCPARLSPGWLHCDCRVCRFLL
jgi:hypothetical protein